MSYDSWTCLMVEKGPGMISDDVRAALKMAACDLHLKKWDRMHIVSDTCDGIIETAWDTHLVGTRSGVLFRTQIGSEDGEYMVNFLLSTDDLERGAEVLREMEERGESVWGRAPTPFPCPALYRFHDLHRTGRRLN
jgi:hypothetical protein